jgi:hypothetical protein
MTYQDMDMQIALRRHSVPSQVYEVTVARKRRQLLQEVRAVEARKLELMELTSSLIERTSLYEMARPLIDMTRMKEMRDPTRLGMPNLVELERAVAVRRAELALAEFRMARAFPGLLPV